MKLAVIKLAEVSDGVSLEAFEDVYSHAVHGVLLPEADVSITVFKDVDAVAVANTVEHLPRIAIEVEETVLLLYFLV